MKFNINSNVKVRLTEKGCKILKEQELAVKEVNGWSEWQLWVLMETFGPYVSMIHSGNLPFETEIEIIKDR